MFRAVLVGCWEDAFVCTDAAILNTDGTADPTIIRASARRWLTLDFGDWKEDLGDICEQAGLGGEVVRAAAVRRLELAKIEDAKRREVEARKIDRAFLAMVEREADGSMTPPQVTASLRHLAEREARL